MMKNFIEASQIKDYENPIILDARVEDDFRSGYENYKQGHLKGAWFMHMEDDLSGEVTEKSGNHPFPKLEDFQEKLRSIGAKKDSTFIVYDIGDNYSAPRLWFMLKYYGLENVYLVNGGLKAIKEEGLEITEEEPTAEIGDVKLVENNDMLASFEEIKKHAYESDEDKAILDARSYERYLSQEEGHIPNTESYYFMNNYDENGKLKNREELKEIYKNVLDKELIVSCGSGVTAC